MDKHVSGANKNDASLTGRYLLLHPEDLVDLVSMKDAVEAMEQAYSEATKWPIVNAPRRRIHSPDKV